jgi:selenide,water dikinase
VVIGLENPDDAAIVRTHENQVTITTDFFTSPLNDPELIGRIAVLNAASDCFVMGAQPTAALAMIQIPHGHPLAQTRMMQELMAGSVQEIARMGAALVGGHSIEGSDLTIGFTFLGRQLTNPTGHVSSPAIKGNLQVGDQLITSKALGTGVLLAALMRSQLPGIAYPSLLHSMLQSNQIALTLIQQGLVSAVTDVTGFGLGGHLCELLTASQKSARIFLEQIPRLPMADQLIQNGLESTLAPENRYLRNVTVDVDLNDSRLSILFDPQTSGGILIGVSKAQTAAVLRLLRTNGFDQAAIIGEIIDDTRLPVALQIR